MRSSPLRSEGQPGRRILGFLAGASVVRTAAFESVGGFDADSGVGGEEERVALRLANRGWDLLYVDSLTVHHYPSPIRDPATRRRNTLRNEVLTAWACRPARQALALSVRLARLALTDEIARAAFAQCLPKLTPVLRRRETLNGEIGRELALLEATRPRP
jgi:GT2 family glycosyltransferase